MTFRRLSSRERDALYKSECERAIEEGREHPSCNLCPLPILPGQTWEASHDAFRPHWLSGEPPSRIAHKKCNRDHGAKVDTPKYAKSERVWKRFRDITRARSPMPGGRDDRLKKKMNGDVVLRSPSATQEL